MTFMHGYCTYMYMYVSMCGSRKYPYPPQGNSLEIPRGRGTAPISKANIFKEGWGFKPKNLPRQGCGDFLEQRGMRLGLSFSCYQIKVRK